MGIQPPISITCVIHRRDKLVEEMVEEAEEVTG
jgi:hypothetical protein